MDLPTETWKTPRCIYRVCRQSYPATSFNPNTQADLNDPENGGRFHPFLDKKGVKVPTLYAADHPNGAFAETIMRGDSPERAISITTIERSQFAYLYLDHDLTLVDLSSIDNPKLKRWLKNGTNAYLALRKLAANIHKQQPDAHGLLWESKQLNAPGMMCMVLFGDRVDSGGITLIDDGPLSDPQNLRMLRQAAVATGYSLPEKYL